MIVRRIRWNEYTIELLYDNFTFLSSDECLTLRSSLETLKMEKYLERRACEKQIFMKFLLPVFDTVSQTHHQIRHFSGSLITIGRSMHIYSLLWAKRFKISTFFQFNQFIYEKKIWVLNGRWFNFRFESIAHFIFNGIPIWMLISYKTCDWIILTATSHLKQRLVFCFPYHWLIQLINIELELERQCHGNF